MITQRAVQPGAVVAHLARLGDRVAPGDPVVVVETMKFESTVAAVVGGTITAIVPLGELVEVGTELCSITPATNPSAEGQLVGLRGGHA